MNSTKQAMRPSRKLFLTFLLLGVLLSPWLGFAAEPAARAGKQRLTVTWFETQASLSVALETPSGEVFLVDTGGVRAASASTPDYNAGRDTLSPFLKKRGYARIDGARYTTPYCVVEFDR